MGTRYFHDAYAYRYAGNRLVHIKDKNNYIFKNKKKENIVLGRQSSQQILLIVLESLILRWKEILSRLWGVGMLSFPMCP